jgi:hypothetical protein
VSDLFCVGEVTAVSGVCHDRSESLDDGVQASLRTSSRYRGRSRRAARWGSSTSAMRPRASPTFPVSLPLPSRSCSYSMTLIGPIQRRSSPERGKVRTRLQAERTVRPPGAPWSLPPRRARRSVGALDGACQPDA